MPSWSIHLALAKRVSDKLHLNEDLFLYGNLIPDIDFGSLKSRRQTHYYDTNIYFDFCNKARKIDIDSFLLDYKKALNNHLILGYYSHLLTDNFYNEIAYSRWIVDEEKNPIGIRLRNNKIEYIDVDEKNSIKQKYKHDDFELYGKKLYKNRKVSVPKDKDIIKKNIKYLKNDFVTSKDVDYRFGYLNDGFKDFNKIIGNEEYRMFEEKELDEIFNECLNMIMDKLKDIVL